MKLVSVSLLLVVVYSEANPDGFGASTLLGAARGLANTGVKGAETVKNYVKTEPETVKNSVKNGADTVKNNVKTGAETAKSAAKSGAETAKSAAKSAAETAKSAAKSGAENAKSAAKSGAETAKSAAKSGAETAKSAAKSGVDAAKDIPNNIASAVSADIQSKVNNGLLSNVDDMKIIITNSAKSMAGIIAKLPDIPAVAAKVADNIWGNLENKISGIVDKESFKKMITDVMSACASMAIKY